MVSSSSGYVARLLYVLQAEAPVGDVAAIRQCKIQPDLGAAFGAAVAVLTGQRSPDRRRGPGRPAQEAAVLVGGDADQADGGRHCAVRSKNRRQSRGGGGRPCAGGQKMWCGRRDSNPHFRWESGF